VTAPGGGRIIPADRSIIEEAAMRVPLVAVAALAVLCAGVTARPSPAAAAEEVRFSSASTPPTPFRQRRAQARGTQARAVPGVPLTGLLTRPGGGDPAPAVVLLHGCRGLRPFQTAWAGRLAEWGYVVLQIDSHGPRGLPDGTCADPRRFRMVGEQVLDAFGAAEFLRTLPFVDAGRMAVMGWGQGGYAALALAQRHGLGRQLGHGFGAVVGLYPDCTRFFNVEPELPALVVNGDDDDQSVAANCRAMAAAAGAAGHRYDLVVLEGARHGFDDGEIPAPTFFPGELNLDRLPAVGVTRGYDAAAERQAAGHVREFLGRHLGP
jgi:dienelactone hydrolase